MKVSASDFRSLGRKKARETRLNLYAPAVDQLLATDYFSYTGASQDPTEVETIWPLTDLNGNVVLLASADGLPTNATHISSSERVRYDSFGIAGDDRFDGVVDELKEKVRARFRGWEFDHDAALYQLGGQGYDPESGRLMSPNRSSAPGANPYTLDGNSPDNVRGRTNAYGQKSDNLGGWMDDYTFYLDPANTLGSGKQDLLTMSIGVGQYVAITSAAVSLTLLGVGGGAGALTSGAAAVGVSGAGVNMAAIGVASTGAAFGVASSTVDLYEQGGATYSQYMALGGIGGAFGGASPLGAIAQVGGGIGGAHLSAALGGDASSGYAWGDLAGGLIGGGLDDFALAAVKGGVRSAALHAAKRVAFQGGGAGVGAGLAYASGNGDSALSWAHIGSNIAGVAGAHLIACFTGETPIVTSPHGASQRADTIGKGDLVLARSEFDPHGPLELKRVEEVFVRRAPVVELVLRGKIIGTTAEHPFYVVERGQFVPAHALVVGETLLGHDGQPSPLEALRDTGRIADVYNFRIADHHTYFVGCDEWGFSVWAHNADYGVHWTSSKSWELIVTEGRLNPSDNNLLWFEYGDSLSKLKDILRGGGKLTGARRTDVAIITDLTDMGSPRIVGGGGQAYLLPEGMTLSGPEGRGLTWWWNSGSSSEIKKIANMIREARRTF